MNRATCSGKCSFCGTRYLTPRYRRNIVGYQELLGFFERIQEKSKTSFSKLEEICLNAGLFPSEDFLVKHLCGIYQAAREFGFDGEVKYIGSQIRTFDAFNVIRKAIPIFSYYLTVETFERRETISKAKKIGNIGDVRKLLENIRRCGFETTILYVLGLDSLEGVKAGFEMLKDTFTRFPVINIFQAYHPSHEKLRHREARNLEYFLKARKIFEEIFSGSDLRPKLWENYRGLWYTRFGGEKLEGRYLQTFIRGY